MKTALRPGSREEMPLDSQLSRGMEKGFLSQRESKIPKLEPIKAKAIVYRDSHSV